MSDYIKYTRCKCIKSSNKDFTKVGESYVYKSFDSTFFGDGVYRYEIYSNDDHTKFVTYFDDKFNTYFMDLSDYRGEKIDQLLQ